MLNPDPEETVPKTREELLSEQFARWERRGRGWNAFPHAVSIEPPFRPFLGHFIQESVPRDDGRRPTALSAIVERLLGRSREAAPRPRLFEDLLAEPEAEIAGQESPSSEIRCALPSGQTVSRETSERLLQALAASNGSLAFEIVAVHDSSFIQFVSDARDRQLIEAQVRAFFPEVSVSSEHDSLPLLWRGSRGLSEVAELGLSREFMLPLHAPSRLDPDPFIALLGAMEHLEAEEIAILQVLFEPARCPWPESTLRAVTDGEGGSFFLDGPDLLKASKEKLSQPLYAVVIRIAAKTPTEGRTWSLLRWLEGALSQFASPDGNELIPLDLGLGAVLEDDLLGRRTHRSGMILNAGELVSLVHLPSASVRSAKLRRVARRTKAPRGISRSAGVCLGENSHCGEVTQVHLGLEDRLRHIHVIGASGSGKSTLLLRLIHEDIEAGRGVAVLDPHGDLIEEAITRVPERRQRDVVLLDPSDEAFPVGLNVLSASSELEKNILSSDLVAVFRRLSTSWGDQMNSVLANAIQAFVESTRGGTLSDLRRFLIEPGFRDRFLESVNDRATVYYWRNEFRLLVGKPQGPILTRLDSFLRPKVIRNMVSQKENRLDIRKAMDDRRILLVKLSQGLIGEENAALLGSLIVSKINQAAISRQDSLPADREPFFVYLDEFHNFATPSMATLLSSARKYRVGLTLAHQELRQLQARDPEVASAVLSNAATRIVFRVGEADARALEGGFSFFESKDLLNLGVGEAICRIERSDNDFNLRTCMHPDVDTVTRNTRRESVLAFSRERYARGRAEVESELYGDADQGHPATTPLPTTTPSVRPEAPARSPVRQLVAAPPKTVALGRGGPQHKYLQELVKKFGESKGYQATIEKEILGGLGSVDVALEREGMRIACEISVSSSAEQELGNLEKCLPAGFDEVALISLEKKTLVRVQELVVRTLEAKQRNRMRFFTPEEFFAYLESKATEEGGETVRGYRIRVGYRALEESERRIRGRAVAQVIGRSLRRLKLESER